MDGPLLCSSTGGLQCKRAQSVGDDAPMITRTPARTCTCTQVCKARPCGRKQVRV